MASTSAAAQACTVPTQAYSDFASRNQVIVFGDLKIRVTDVDGDYRWIVIDLKVPGRDPTLGLRLTNGQSFKVTACGPEVTVMFVSDSHYPPQFFISVF